MFVSSSQGEQGDIGLPGPPGDDRVPVVTDISVIFQGRKGDRGPIGEQGFYGSPGIKGWQGDRVNL
jgi:hypothetical protein